LDFQKLLLSRFAAIRGLFFRRFWGNRHLIKTGLIFILSLSFIFAQSKKFDAVSHDKTNFPLTGKHRTTACSECHPKGIMQGTPSDCEACHWYRKQDDRYRLQLGIHCADCHTPFDWKKIKPGSWEHTRDAGFPLQGVHKFVDCFQCHQGGVFSGQTSECFDCHEKDYNKTDDPGHVQQQFPTDCQICHNMVTWEGAVYNHFAFLLQGMHKTAACNACHQNNVYEGTPSECVDCHLTEYNQTGNPNHMQAGYSTDCEKCHGNNALDWHGATFNHNRFWPIRGAHRGLDCNDCHAQGYVITGQCVDCHLDDYNNTKNPNHRQAGFHTQCEICHPPESLSWSQANFDHRFPIFSGDHSHISCSDCHESANYYEFSCINCHEHNKNAMDNEHNSVGGYSYNSQACYSCHPTGQE
ncbi:MAG: hypothetical protein KAW12_03265, partial [Candidatus Aminicenantes bacterium]|nr:hypothetical protein [Candidatus Aminicenantes bacterium]